MRFVSIVPNKLKYVVVFSLTKSNTSQQSDFFVKIVIVNEFSLHFFVIMNELSVIKGRKKNILSTLVITTIRLIMARLRSRTMHDRFTGINVENKGILLSSMAFILDHPE